MLSLGPGVQIVLLATEPIDLRRGHDGLVTLVRSLWKADPYASTAPRANRSLSPMSDKPIQVQFGERLIEAFAEFARAHEKPLNC